MNKKRKSSKHQSSLVDDVDLLTPKQRIFSDQYLANGFNQYQAYIHAFGEGKSKGAASVSASKLLKQAKVARYISQKQDSISLESDLDAKALLQVLKSIIFSDPRKYHREDGTPKDIRELDDSSAAAVTEFETAELFEGDGDQKHAYGLRTKIKRADKLKAVELYGKYLKMFTDKQELSGPDGSPLDLALKVVFVDGDE